MDEKKRGKQAKGADKPQKRRRSGDNVDAKNYTVGNTAVSLTRDQLLSFSSEDFEAFIAKVSSQRPLTAVEEKEVKRQRRLIKNRESAHASRQRKREFLEELQAQINELKDERDSLRADNCRLRENNAQLQEHVAILEKQVQSQSHMRDLWQSMTTLRKTNLASSAGAKAAGVCLLIVLFSFGLFLNTNGAGGLPTPGRLSPFVAPYPQAEVVPRVVEPARSMAGAAGGAIVDSMNWAGHKRKLLSFPSFNSSPSVVEDYAEPSLGDVQAVPAVEPLPSWKNSNITYLMCSDVEQLVASAPPESGAYPGEPYVVLLLPSKGADASEATSLTCRLVDISRVRVERDDIHEPMILSS
jgi:hypothetical protein